MHLDTRTDPARPIWQRPMFLAAAAALVVVAIVGAALATGDDGAVETPPAEEGEVPATGWYLPPSGWEITEVRTDFLDVGEMGGCPCRSWIAAGEGPEPAAIIVGETAGPLEAVAARFVDVGGREGQVQEPGGDLTGLVVESEGTNLSLVGSRVGIDALVDVADSWLDQVEAGDAVDPSALVLPDGMSGGEVVASPAMTSVHLVDVTAVERSSGRTAYYSVVPAGAWYQSLVLDAASVVDRDGRFEVRSTIGSTPFVALVGGPADLSVGPSFFSEEGDLVTTEDLRAFLGGMRQVAVGEWRAAIADARVEPEVLAAETLFGPPLVDASLGG